MASDVEIANAALIKLGAGRITSLNDDVNNARVLNARYEAVRDAELRRRKWRFSLRRTSVAALSTAPSFGFLYQYQVPDGFLRLVQIGEYDLSTDLTDNRRAPEGLYSLEGNAILTNLTAPLKIRYIKQITDESAMDVAFREAFASRLAYESANEITDDLSKKDDALRDYKMALSEATKANAIEGAVEYPSDDSWVTARLG